MRQKWVGNWEIFKEIFKLNHSGNFYLFWKVVREYYIRLPLSLMLEILPSISAGSDKPRNGLISKVEGGNSSSGGVWALFLLLFEPTLLALGWPSWACFKCCFILSGRENSFWQIEHGKTLRAAPSWYKKACLWKLYLFLKCLLICTRSHSTHLKDTLALRLIEFHLTF